MNLRTWATPLAGAVFVVMAVTGGLMFFDLNTPQGHTLHEWLGWALIIGVALHLATNWGPLKNHLSKTPGRLLAGTAVFLLVGASIPMKEQNRGPNPVRTVMMTLSKSPVKELAPLVHRSTDEVVAELKKAGFTAATADSTADQLAGEDRDARGKVLAVIFPAPAGPPGR